MEVVANASEAKTDDKVSINYSAEELIKMPVGLNFESIINLTPGVTGSGTGVSVRGSQTGQVLYRIDGINVKDDTGGNTTLYAPLPDSIEDVQVVLSALNSRYGLVNGGQINMVTKSGSNNWEGTIRSYLKRNAWQANLANASPADNHNLNDEDFSRYVDVTTSGPIWKDHLWFSLGARFQPNQAKRVMLGYTAHGRLADGTTVPWDTLRNVSGNTAQYGLRPMSTYGLNPGVDSIVNAGPGGTYGVSLEDAGQIVNSATSYNKVEGKLTGAINENHVVYLTLLTDGTTEGASIGEHTGDPWMVQSKSMIGDLKTKTQAYTLGWNGTLSSNWTIEARAYLASRKAYDVPNPNPGVSVMGYMASQSPDMTIVQEASGLGHDWINWEDGYRYGTMENRLSTYNQPEKRGNQGYSVNLKTFQDFMGKHEIDVGGEFVGTVYNFGRSKEGSRAVWQGGWYKDSATGGYLYPVFRRGAPGTAPSEILSKGAGDPGNGWPGLSPTNDQFVHWSDAMRGPSAHMEMFWNNPSDAKNSTTSFWVNDVWTLSSQWNLLLGARLNRLIMQDEGGHEVTSQNLLEPRLQLKFNPDGQNKEVYSFSVAKLASAYSDQMANQFRGNEWEIRTVHLWSGANLAIPQPGFDTPGALSDAPVGTYNGYNYTGKNMNGVRFVDYATLIDPKNYGSSFDFVDARQTYIAKNLRAPFTIELNLGYQRNYDSGYFKANVVKRYYKDDIVGPIHGYGTDYLVHMVSPAPNDPLRMYKGASYWINSGFTREFTGLEFAFRKQLTSRVSMEGGYTWDRTTGTNALDYYNWKNLRESLLTPAQQEMAVGKGMLNRNQVGHLILTYVHPVGRGNVSFSLKGDTWLSGFTTPYGRADYRALAGFQQLPSTINGERVVDIDPRPGNADPYYSVLLGNYNDYKTGVDYYQVGAKIQWDIPIGLGKTHFVGYISIDNLFNHFILTDQYGYFSDQVTGYNTAWWDGVISGRSYAAYRGGQTYGAAGNPWAPNNSYNNGWGGRRVGDFSFGFKF
ncbi:TonB-dependent receptor [Geothrix sp. PMB-07]|uniref:TonB-dependent receptor n=1 Tax=Geothrix sp. PMB-07 TaxID=3068640 RepID=UPI002741CE3B|nr:TonB-dependent receptor plug domain-containing protein [Geothrix sp. PMB-07]WLT32360.1 TonB-dependent receptor plug domain-containing protein [Geothrix sp. PMB-07]